MPTPDIKRLKASWTKFSAVQVVDVIPNNQFSDTVLVDNNIDDAILKAFFGINSLNDEVPDYWVKIKNHPKQLRLFSLIAALFTHYQIIEDFASKYSDNGKRKGVFKVRKGNKMDTNIRQALLRSGAAVEKYHKESEVPYNLSPLFESGEVGILAKELFKDRLVKIGYSADELSSTSEVIKICQNHNFHKALSLTKSDFADWLNGRELDTEAIYSFNQLKIYKELPLLKVNQWLNDWDDVDFSEELRAKPKPHYYVFSIDARLLKRLSDVHRRNPNQPRASDSSIQRAGNENRIKEISNYIEGGFPWSTLSEKERMAPENLDLKMPGLLPTAIIANVLKPGDRRNKGKLADGDEIKIVDEVNKPFSKLIIPDQVFESNWNPSLKPIEIIDGQHRLWAFDENDPISGNYEIPVVVFHDLDRTWQAYLFYTINIKPVKINTSLGYDLYPLLRTQKWLERSKEGAFAYRETRAQELVEALWLYPANPWYQRINMIGETGGPTMSQAAYIRALTSSFLKSRDSLFGSAIAKTQVLDWNRSQQAAFLILLWNTLATAVENCTESWAKSLRRNEGQLSILADDLDPAFFSKYSLLSRDQGVRGILSFSNDFFFIAAHYNEDLNFYEFSSEEELSENILEPTFIESAIEQFKASTKLMAMLEAVGMAVTKVDWRTSSAPNIDEEDRKRQMIYRGGSGYKEISKAIHKAFDEVEVSPFISKYINQIKD